MTERNRTFRSTSADGGWRIETPTMAPGTVAKAELPAAELEALLDAASFALANGWQRDRADKRAQCVRGRQKLDAARVEMVKKRRTP